MMIHPNQDLMPKAVIILFILATVLSFSCKGKKDIKDPGTPPPTFVINKDSVKPDKKGNPVRPPIVNINDTIATKYIVLYVKDSASGSERISGSSKSDSTFLSCLSGSEPESHTSL